MGDDAYSTQANKAAVGSAEGSAHLACHAAHPSANSLAAVASEVVAGGMLESSTAAVCQQSLPDVGRILCQLHNKLRSELAEDV